MHYLPKERFSDCQVLQNQQSRRERPFCLASSVAAQRARDAYVVLKNSNEKGNFATKAFCFTIVALIETFALAALSVIIAPFTRLIAILLPISFPPTHDAMQPISIFIFAYIHFKSIKNILKCSYENKAQI